MHRLIAALVGLSLAACGTGASVGESHSHVTEADRSRATTALELLVERFPNVRVSTRSGSPAVQIRQYAHPPLLIIDGRRTLASAAEALSQIPSNDVVDIDVKAAMSDTMVYGADAALGGVIELTTRLGQGR